MGMDVFGNNPTSKTGEYFRRNVWGWHPLAKFITDECPAELTGKCESWHDNSGCGLDADDSITLAALLDDKVSRGEVAEYVKGRDEWLATLPDEDCNLCKGSGVRSDEVGKAAGQPERVIAEAGHPRDGQTGWCNGCNGKGTVEPWERHYGLDVDDIAQFAAFLKDCGGFSIC